MVRLGQVKRYFAYESRHQHGAIDKTGGFKYFFFHPNLGEMIQFHEKIFSNGLKQPTRSGEH